MTLRTDALAGAALLSLPALESLLLLAGVTRKRLAESERLLDEAIECSFPASDPIAVQDAYEAACEREDREARRVSDG